MATTWYDGRIVRIEPLNANTRRFVLEVPELDRFDFQPGQFITMDLPVHEKRVHRWRSYSIAAGPDGSNQIELCIARVEGGLATRYLFEDVGVGTTIRFKGPGGAFVLPDIEDKDLVLVCTGTGVAPFRSMLQDIIRHGRPYRHIHLVFGTRYVEGVLYAPEFCALEETLPGFRFSVALSRAGDQLPEGLPFEVYAGYVHAIYQEAYGTPRADVLFMLCGWSNMIDAARQSLVEELGFAPSQVVTELYG